MVEHELHITSLVVHALPDCAARIAVTIAGWQGCEVRGSSPDGKLVVVMEAPSGRRIMERVERINALAGVLNSALVFHHCEPSEDLTEENDSQLPPATVGGL